jgi:predicted permease
MPMRPGPPKDDNPAATRTSHAGLGPPRTILADVVRDLRHGLRTLARTPGFALAALASLAIGIGANTTIFSVVNALLLRPVPYRDADRLVILWNRSPGLNITEDWFSTAQFFDIKEGHGGFDQLAMAIGALVTLTSDGEPERVGAVRVSSSLLPMLGVVPSDGRLFTPDDDAPGRTTTAILTHGMWVRRYGASPDVVGRSLTLNGQPVRIVGILPASFSLPREIVPLLYGGDITEVFLSLPLNAAAPRTRNREDYNIIGRLRAGVSVGQAQAEMDTITARLRRDHPDVYPPNGGLTFSVVPLLEQAVGTVRVRLYVLLGAVGLVLLVACANVANLLLARAIARQKEFALRAALGAGRGRVVRQLLAESLLLALAGGALGVVLAYWGLSGVRALGPRSIPRLAEIAIDGRVLAFTLLVSAGSGLLFGLAPALRISRIDLTAALKQAGQGAGDSTWGRGHATRRLLVVSELALSVLLLIGAGLLIRSFANLQSVDPGFNPRGVLTFGLQLNGRQYNGPQPVLAAYRQIWERLDRLPGVRASGGASDLPLTDSPAWTPISIEGRTPPPGEKFINADMRVVAGRYFETMEIPLRRGRLFNDQDISGHPGVVLVDDRMAREYWPNQDPIGKRLRRGGAESDAPWLTVVGVVGRVKHESLDSDPRIAFYLPHGQAPARALSVVARTSTDPAQLVAAVTQAIREVDAALPVYAVRTMEANLDRSLARHRFSVVLLGVFAAIALMLAAVGTYGVMAYVVGQSTREIGIRIALGAGRGRVMGLVLGQGLLLAATGVAVGLVGAFWLSQFVRTLLFEVEAHDPLTFAAVPGVLLVVAATACLVPALRATRVDPAVVLRGE